MAGNPERVGGARPGPKGRVRVRGTWTRHPAPHDHGPAFTSIFIGNWSYDARLTAALVQLFDFQCLARPAAGSILLHLTRGLRR